MYIQQQLQFQPCHADNAPQKNWNQKQSHNLIQFYMAYVVFIMNQYNFPQLMLLENLRSLFTINWGVSQHWQFLSPVLQQMGSQQYKIMMEQEQHITQQLSCSVCMCLFKNPVTIQCGHTFCRFCLLNYTRTKPSCPICRTPLTHVSEHPPQDEVINRIVEYIKRKETKKQHNNSNSNNAILDHFQHLLLLDIRCNDLLLPFTKVVATFQLQSPTLISKLERFVARQEIPFNKYGVVSKITYLNQLRYNVYECVIEGRSFCQINDEQIQKNSDQNQQFFYRSCQAKVIYQDDEIDRNILEDYLKKFSLIKDKKLLHKIYKSIDHQKIYSKHNTTAAFYSIIKIIPQSDQNKYAIAISFDHQKRQQFIKRFLQKCTYDIAKYPHKFVSVKLENGIRRQGFVLLVVFLIILFLAAFNNDFTQL